MQRIARRQLALGVKIEPALAALIGRAGIHATPKACSRPPGSSIRYCCSGVSPKVYLISKSAKPPSGPSVRTKNLPSRRKKIDFDVALAKMRVLEIAENRLVVRDLHRAGVMRFAPGVVFAPVAGGAALRADELRLCLRASRRAPEKGQQDEEREKKTGAHGTSGWRQQTGAPEPPAQGGPYKNAAALRRPHPALKKDRLSRRKASKAFRALRRR